MPLLGGAIIVGAGFGAWAFTDSQTVVIDAPGSVNVTSLLEMDVKLLAQYDVNQHNESAASYDYVEISSTGSDATFSLELDQGKLYSTDVALGVTPYVTIESTTTSNSTPTTVSTDYDITGIVIEISYKYAEGDPTLTELFSEYTYVLSNFTLGYYDRKNADTSDNPYAVEKYAVLKGEVATALTNAQTTVQSVPQIKSHLDTTTDQYTDNMVYQSSALAFTWQYVADKKPATLSSYEVMSSEIAAEKAFVLNLSIQGVWTPRS